MSEKLKRADGDFVKFDHIPGVTKMVAQLAALEQRISEALNILGPSVPPSVKDQGAAWEWSEALRILKGETGE